MRGQVSETLIRPVFFILMIVSAGVAFGTPLAPSFAVGVGAMGVSFLIGDKMLRGVLPAALKSANALMGSVGLLLLMTNHEREVAVGYTAGLCLNGCLGLLLIPLWGVEGAAWSKVCGLMFWNILLVASVKRRLGINATVFKILHDEKSEAR